MQTIFLSVPDNSTPTDLIERLATLENSTHGTKLAPGNIKTQGLELTLTESGPKQIQVLVRGNTRNMSAEDITQRLEADIVQLCNTRTQGTAGSLE